MKKIIKIHPLTYILLLYIVFTAHIYEYAAYMTLIFIHEFGHIILSIIFKWKIKEIIVMPLGALTKYITQINIPMYQELTVASSGIIIQLIIYLLFLRNNIFFYYSNLLIILFNILPIYPLDGSKILNVLLNKIFSFKTSCYLSYYISYICFFIVIMISFIYKDILLIISFIPILINLIKYYKKIPNIIHKFCLERYLYDYSHNKVKIIKGLKINKMQRDKYHYFQINNNLINEKEVFDNQYILW